jgi:hypothetical protein
MFLSKIQESFSNIFNIKLSILNIKLPSNHSEYNYHDRIKTVQNRKKKL